MSHRPSLLIGVFSASGNTARRQACRDTWVGQAAAHQGTDVVFVIGDPTRSAPHRDGDLLMLPCSDDYAALPQKTRGLCQWALDTAQVDRLLKCDDDTYVAVDRLSDLPLRADYLGCKLRHYASGGAGYLLSRTAASIVARDLLAKTGCEDLLAGRVLSAAGIQLTSDRRFRAWPEHGMPRPGNNLITGHGWSACALRAIHAGLSCPPPSAASGQLSIPRIIHRIWLGGHEMPEPFQQYGHSWRAHHPQWSLLEWNESQLPPLINQHEFETSGALAGKADILRYELLNLFGGLYVDTDVECLRNIEPLLPGVEAFVAREDPRLICGAVMGGRPAHPLFRTLIDNLPAAFAAHTHPDGRYDLHQSGPQYLTRQVYRWNQQAGHRVRIFPPQVFFPYHWSQPAPPSSHFPDAYAVHHWACTWKSRP